MPSLIPLVHRIMCWLSITRIGFFQLVAIRRLKPGEIIEFRKRKKARKWIATLPRFGKVVSVEPQLTPSVGFCVVPDSKVILNPRFSAVVQGSQLLLPPGFDVSVPKLVVSRPPVANVYSQIDNTVLIRCNSTSSTIPRAVFVGTASPHNWFHWVIDTLPAIYATRFLPHPLDQLPILIPISVLEKPDWVEILSMISGSRERVPLSGRHYTRVSELVWVLGATTSEPAPSTGQDGKFMMEINMMREFADVLETEVCTGLATSLATKFAAKRLFLARSSSALRRYNQHEIIEVAGEYGFQPFYFESLPLAEAVRAVNEAEFIIGPHGAAWANALFAKSARGALVWTWEGAEGENWFHNVLAVREIPVDTIYTGPGSNSSDYTLSVQVFRDALQKMLARQRK